MEHETNAAASAGTTSSVASASDKDSASASASAGMVVAAAPVQKRETLAVTAYARRVVPEPYTNAEKVKNLKLAVREKYYAGMTDDEILAQMERNRAEAAEKGTTLHAAVEHLWVTQALPSAVDLSHEEESERMQAVYYRERMIKDGWRLYAAEFPVVYEGKTITLRGTIDAVLVKDPPPEKAEGKCSYAVIDWKRTRDLAESVSPRFSPVFPEIPLTDFARYSLQVHLYAEILRRKYGIDASRFNTLLVCMHPSRTAASELVARDYSAIAKILLDRC